MRKARIAAATAIAAPGLTVGIATSASAAPPLNYGQCVNDGTVSASEGTIGPDNSNSAVFPSAAVHANVQSNGNSRFTSSQSCAIFP
jgi:hypothetical protein